MLCKDYVEFKAYGEQKTYPRCTDLETEHVALKSLCMVMSSQLLVSTIELLYEFQHQTTISQMV